MKIFLIRHGKPDIKLNRWTNINGYVKLLREYNRCGIVADKYNSNKVKKIVGNNALFFSSDLPRAVETAQHVLLNSNFKKEKIFREAELPVIRIPIIANYFIWRSISRGFWLMGIKKENYKRSKKRAEEAAIKLISKAEERDVVLFGHGIMNSLLARELKARGWKLRIPLGINYWNVIILEQ
ncbi:MAG: histidine phosphatase family protein [Chlorobi bacterium]|nr:histidine phosphatase family protein [Chlorobiota bacterium]